MLDNLIFSLNATMPIFVIMVIGYIAKKIGFIAEENIIQALNKIVFRLFLPVLIFKDLANQDFQEIWDGSFVGYCFLVTLVSIGIAFLFSLLCKDKTDRGEIIQASYRSAAATLGIAFMSNIYNNVAMVALMIIGSVPLYNTAAVIILALTSPNESNNQSKKDLIISTIKKVITNPIIIGVIVGTLWALLKIPQPTIMAKTINSLASVASPLALIALGASFEFSDLKEKLGPICLVIFNKLFLFCILFLPVAITMGFRNEKLVAILIMLGSATTSSSYIMAKNMGHKGIISSSAVMITTLLASFSLTFWLFLLRNLSFI